MQAKEKQNGIREFPKARVIELRFFFKPYFSFLSTTTTTITTESERCLGQLTPESTDTETY